MARDLCLQCQRPIVACICAFIVKTYNKIPVLVLQHPNEVLQSKGTVAILQRSLNDCHVLIGENFTDNGELNDMLAMYQPILLYPGEQATELTMACNEEVTEFTHNAFKHNNTKPCLLIIDGTWKKAYRMFMLSKNLHNLKQVCLPTVFADNGQYLIRKVNKKNALSSLEATCYALALLEGELRTSIFDLAINENSQKIDCGQYQPLLNKFSQFNQFQLSFRE
ncbi:DTW domain-containing protein [Colwellia sp. MSW7]|jgi:DTW domain-containing protein YfiP|uniref:tRNA-uridine aminocarboxypropyltransferase n=1 Tax=Colwellia maritima TaxID=2912588 RepID=A0ABS9X235_9GAMM|nr:tRNA-uridine aminocarboxypropyltransferase [Colwellia maritima]MCI2284130.1 DTW domain-containing protein [Colwellia maritima]